MNAGLSNLSRFYSTLPEEEFSNRDGVFCSPFCEDVVFFEGSRVSGEAPSLQILPRRLDFCLRLGRRIAEWLDEARPTKDIFRFLAGGVEVVVWRVCNGNTSGGGCGGAGFSLAGAGDAFGRGGLFCRLSCLCGSVFPGQQDCPVVLASCPRDDYGCGSVWEWRRLISHLYIF